MKCRVFRSLENVKCKRYFIREDNII